MAKKQKVAAEGPQPTKTAGAQHPWTKTLTNRTFWEGFCAILKVLVSILPR